MTHFVYLFMLDHPFVVLILVGLILAGWVVVIASIGLGDDETNLSNNPPTERRDNARP